MGRIVLLAASLARGGPVCATIAVLNAGAKWNERYSSGEASEQAPLPGLLDACCNIPPGIALDLACGTGRHAKALARCGWRVIALDVSEVAIGNLRRVAAADGLAIEARVQDLEDPEFRMESDAYDLVCDCLYLQRSLFAEIRRAVRPGGIFFAALPLVDTEPGVRPMNPDYLVNSGELAAEFKNWRIMQYSEMRSRPGARMIAQLTAQRPTVSR
jgi:SAM-dependent methyltransferase